MTEKKAKRYNYGTDIFDMSMELDDPTLLNEEGKKKRIQWKRRKLI